MLLWGETARAVFRGKLMYEKLDVVFDDRLLVGESPLWDEKEKKLYFVDIRGKCYYRMNYSDGTSEKQDLPQWIGCLALCDNGDLLLSMEDGIYRRTCDGLLTLAHQPIKIKGERFNDGKVGPDGHYYVGTAGADFSGAFYRLWDGRLEELFDRCGCSNGIDWSADSKTLYYIDSREQKLEKFSFSADLHSLSDRKTISEIPPSFGCGDGMCIDAKGDLWMAVWGASCVQHIEAASGRVLETVHIPATQVSSCCFAGDDLCDLIITTAAVRTEFSDQPHAGKVFCYRTDVCGVNINRYTGR